MDKRCEMVGLALDSIFINALVSEDGSRTNSEPSSIATLGFRVTSKARIHYNCQSAFKNLRRYIIGMAPDKQNSGYTRIKKKMP
jgi:hypothetical protein